MEEEAIRNVVSWNHPPPPFPLPFEASLTGHDAQRDALRDGTMRSVVPEQAGRDA